LVERLGNNATVGTQAWALQSCPLAMRGRSCHRQGVKKLFESLARVRPALALGKAGALVLALASAPALAANHGVHLPPLGCSGPPSETWLNVTIDKIRSDRGVIALTVYPDDKRKFLIDGGSLYVVRAPARVEKVKMCLFLPQPGIYALAVYHDEDNSGALNRIGPMGLPAEGFGFSGNPSSIESLLEFRSVRLAVPRTNLSTRIKMRYP
jgi:uncharacterized protein (DUF2141 family)